MESQGGSKPSFDIAAMSMAMKGILVVGVLLLIDSFLAWQQVCVIPGILRLGKRVGWERGLGRLPDGHPAHRADPLRDLEAREHEPATTDRAVEGHRVSRVRGRRRSGLIKFLLVLFDDVPGFGAWIGIILLAALGYFSFLYLKAEEAATAPPPPQTEL